MPVGAIKWFSRTKGYGFITRQDGVDVFVHFTGLADSQDRHFDPGDAVAFDEVAGEKGPKAVNVRRSGDEPDPTPSKGET